MGNLFTVILLGSMIVNEEPVYTGESPGYFTGLDLEGNMYLGSVPDFDNIPRAAGFRKGFVGKHLLYKVNCQYLNACDCK